VSNGSDLIKQIKQLSAQSRAELEKYIRFLQWQEAQQQQTEASGWSFSFIEAFKEADIRATTDPAGMDVNMALALVGGQSRPALWAHPPVAGQAVIEYHVPVPRQVTGVRLRLAIGVRDGAQVSENNLVAFSVKVNGIRVWGQQSNAQNWQETEIPLELVAGDVARLAFITEALGNHQWTWAVWGNPELTGTLETRG